MHGDVKSVTHEVQVSFESSLLNPEQVLAYKPAEGKFHIDMPVEIERVLAAHKLKHFKDQCPAGRGVGAWSCCMLIVD